MGHGGVPSGPSYVEHIRYFLETQLADWRWRRVGWTTGRIEGEETMLGTRTTRIKAILGKREAPARQLKQTADRLDACRQAVAELEQLRGQLTIDAPADVSER